MALATILLHLNFTFTLLLIHPPAGMVCAGMCDERGVCVPWVVQLDFGVFLALRTRSS